MKVYVIGAGVSKTVGYPLGGELFQEVDTYVRKSGACIDGFDYATDWPELCRWLGDNDDPLLAEAYKAGNLEYIFTVLDLARKLRRESRNAVARYVFRPESTRAAEAEEASMKVDAATREHERSRRILLQGVAHYLQCKHHDDSLTFHEAKWQDLRKFGRKIRHGDVIITFNYDSTFERILLEQSKWTPKDGYGFEVSFQRSGYDTSPVNYISSPVRVLHLHGAVGWYEKTAVMSDPVETHTSLGPNFLAQLGIEAADVSLPHPQPMSQPVVIHPSFLKDYEISHGTFVRLWQMAAEHLRKADAVLVIGYSLPDADSAALTLLLTNCDRNKVEIVNTDEAANYRLKRLLTFDMLGVGPVSLQQWLERVTNSPS